MINQESISRFNRILFPVVIILTFSGCADPLNREPQLSDLDNPNPLIKIMAVKWAGDNKVSSAAPQLVGLLQDEDRSVRFYSIQALKRIAGTDLGYDYKAAADVRGEAVKRWLKFLKTGQSEGIVK